MNKTNLFLLPSILSIVLNPVLADEVRRAIHFPDLVGYQTIACDLHMHTIFSDGQVWPPVRVVEAWRQGLDAISITDHIEYQPHKDDVKPNQLVLPARATILVKIEIGGVTGPVELKYTATNFVTEPQSGLPVVLKIADR